MTYDLFWNSDCTLVRAYRKADKLRLERKNEEFWLQGMYIYEALCDVSPILRAFAKNGTRAYLYAKEPYSFSKEEQEQKKEAEQFARIEKLKARLIKDAIKSK